MNPKLNPASLGQLQWRPGMREFVYAVKSGLVRGTTTDIRIDTLVRLNDMNLILKMNGEDTLKRFPAITFKTADDFWFTSGNKLFLCEMMKNKVGVVNSWPDKSENTDIHKTTFLVAYTRDNNLYVSKEGKEIAISAENNTGILYGSNRVHRNEFGIEKGTFWSPDGTALAFYRMDETNVAEYPLVDITTRIAKVAPTRYPMAGQASHKVTVGVYSIAAGKTIYLRTDSSTVKAPGSDIEYLTNITWSPDGKVIFIACLNRDQNFMQLNKYDAVTGRYIKTLFTEQNPAYVEPLHGPEFAGGDGGKFIWQSRRDGYNHLYLYTTSGELISQVTRGPWEVTQYLKTDPEGRRVYFNCNKDNPIDNYLYVADMTKGKITRLTPGAGTHNTKVSDDGKFILDSYSSTSIARQVELLDENGKSLRVLLANENPLKDYKLGTTTIFTLKSEDNTNLYCRMIKPADFSPDKKYPVIIYVYGGPHSQLVTNTWLGGGGLFLNYLAGIGYVVFTLDNRGTSYRGAAFEQAIFRNLGTKEVSDQMAGVKYLKSLPFVDSTRIGINGWSYGGFMTISMFLKSPGTFKVAVCGGPVTDWKYYEVMYGERYMDTPESNPEGYKNACLLNYVKNLKGKLLIIHDDQDNTVVPQNSLTFLKKCVDEGKPVDFFFYPGHEHNVRGKDRVHLNQKMVQYFQDYL